MVSALGHGAGFVGSMRNQVTFLYHNNLSCNYVARKKKITTRLHMGVGPVISAFGLKSWLREFDA